MSLVSGFKPLSIVLGLRQSTWCSMSWWAVAIRNLRPESRLYCGQQRACKCAVSWVAWRVRLMWLRRHQFFIRWLRVVLAATSAFKSGGPPLVGRREICWQRFRNLNFEESSCCRSWFHFLRFLRTLFPCRSPILKKNSRELMLRRLMPVKHCGRNGENGVHDVGVTFKVECQI